MSTVLPNEYFNPNSIRVLKY